MPFGSVRAFRGRIVRVGDSDSSPARRSYASALFWVFQEDADRMKHEVTHDKATEALLDQRRTRRRRIMLALASLVSLGLRWRRPDLARRIPTAAYGRRRGNLVFA